MKVTFAFLFLALLILHSPNAESGPYSDHNFMLSQMMPPEYGRTIYDTKEWVEYWDAKDYEDWDKRISKRRSCEKWHGKLRKTVDKAPEKAWGKPTKRGNYPHPLSIRTIGIQAHYLGLINLNGCPDSTKVTKNLQEARRNFELAALQFNERSMYQLGLMLYKGVGGEKDETAGIAWINTAAAEWSLDAGNFLSVEGLPVPSRVKFQSKVLISDATKHDNFDPKRWAAFKNTVGFVTVMVVGAYVAKEFPIAVADPNAFVSPQGMSTSLGQSTSGGTSNGSTQLQKSVPVSSSLAAVTSVSNFDSGVQMCPDGSFQPTGGACHMCPDGSFTTSPPCRQAPDGSFVGDKGGGVRLAPTGRYVRDVGSMTACPDGSYVAGNWCHMAPDGSFVGVTR